MPDSTTKQTDHTLKSASVPAYLQWGRQLLICLLLSLLACGRQPSPFPQIPETTPTSTPTPQAETGATSPAPTPSPQPASTIGIDPEGIQGVLLRIWHPWSGRAGQAMEEMISRFNASNPYGLQVESAYIGNYNSLDERVQSAPPEDLPQIAVGYAYQIQDWQNSGIEITDLSLYLNEPEWGFEPHELADFFPAFIEKEQMSRIELGFPAQRFTQVMIYNKTWANELGISSSPGTPAAFYEQACRASQANKNDDDPTNDGTGGWLINTTPPAMLSWFYSFGARIISPGNDGYQFNTQEIKTALEFLKDLFDAGCAWDSPESDPLAELAARRALLITTSITDLTLIRSALEKNGSTDDWLALPFPSEQSQPALAVYGPSFAILKSSPEEDLAAWLLIKWLAEPEQQALMVSNSSSLVIRESTLEHLKDYSVENPQWALIQTYLDHARPEPELRSWETVRWVLSDVGTQVFRYYFTRERIPATLELLEETAAELHARSQN